MRIVFLFIFFTLFIQNIYSQVNLVERNQANFIVANSNKAADIIVDTETQSVITAAKLFVEDVKKVTGKTPRLLTKAKSSKFSIILGVLGESPIIDELIRKGKIDSVGLNKSWERYKIVLLDKPIAGIDKGLVVVGSDRRGAAYGILSISEAIGVSPWYWWADVPVIPQHNLYLKVQDYVSSSPSVKYRGVFINDEDWGLLPWAKRTFDPELNDIGPKTYAKVFELLLRLKANYLCPAMHEASGAFNKYPLNKVVADSFGIVMGSVHPEPLLFNNASEWDKKTMGEWNYMTNKEGIIKVLDKRVKENSPYENVYTLALRGLHDKAMTGGYTLEERVKLVSEALKDQRKILTKYIDKPIENIPQAFTPYKEVLDLYLAGLDLPEDVILVWPDDNYGYMKQLSNSKERERSGGSGVYYHASYLGIPHDYLWISSTSPTLMYEELVKAYNTGADRLWLLNVGDIKSTETPMTQFLQMAYDLTSFNFDNSSSFQAKWLSKIFGEKYYDDILLITQEYNRLAFVRKPEFMGWGEEWNSFKNARERTQPTQFSFSNYGEAESRIQDYQRIIRKVEELYHEMPEHKKSSFFQLLYYPIKGAGLMNLKWLYAQKNNLYKKQARSSTNLLKDSVKQIFDDLYKISYEYNNLESGKWEGIMSLKQGVTASYFEMPKLDSLTPLNGPKLGVYIEGKELLNTSMSLNILPSFSPILKKKYFLDIYNKGNGSVKWKMVPSNNWIDLSKSSGTTELEEKIWVDIDWDKISDSIEHEIGFIDVISGTDTVKIWVNLDKPKEYKAEEIKGLFVEDNGVVSIPGGKFHRKQESEEIKITQINNFGIESTSVMLGDPLAQVQNPRDDSSPKIEYDFFTLNSGYVDVYTYVLPTFPLSSDRDFGFHEQGTSQTRYSLRIDNNILAIPASSALEYTQEWSDNVLRNFAINKSTFYINEPGKHTLKILCGDPGLIIQKIVIDFGGLKKSYLGPRSTQFNR